MPAKLAPRGPEFQVNQVTPNSQLDPDITALADGRFIVVYTSVYDPGTNVQYSGDDDILGQLVNPDGTLSGSALSSSDIFLNVLRPDGTLLVSASTPLIVETNASLQRNPAVAAGPHDALVVYEDNTGSSHLHIAGRFFHGGINAVGNTRTFAD